MEMHNIKLDWGSILENHIEWLEELYDSDQIRSSYEAIIPLLIENKIPSRVIVTGGKVIAYAFYIKGNEDERIYSTMGFLSTKIDEGKISFLVDWLIDESRRENKTIIMNGIFNEPINFMELITKKDFNVINRIRMELELTDNVMSDYVLNDKIEFKNIHNSNLEETCDLIYDSFRGLPERILLPAGDNRSKLLSKSLMDGTYGKIMEKISYLVSENNNTIGGVIFTDGSTELKKIPLLLFIFVLSDYRGKGLSEEILARAIFELKKSGIKEVQLWVDRNNFAYNIYKKSGFKECENEKTPIYFFTP